MPSLQRTLPQAWQLLAALLLLSAAAHAQTLGLTSVGSTAYPDQGLRRVAKLVLYDSPAYNIQGMYGGLIDPPNHYAYFGGRHGSFSKVNLSSFTDETNVALTLVGNSGEGFVDSANGFAYMKNGNTVAKIKLGGPGVAPVEVAGLPLNMNAMVLDASNPDPTLHYGYFASYNGPSAVYKYLLPSPAHGDADAMAPTLIGSVTLNSPAFPSAGLLLRGTIDPSGGYAYFACANNNQVVRIALNGAGAPTEAGVVTTSDPAATASYGRIPAVDTSGPTHYAYLSLYVPFATSTITKLNLSSFTEVASTTLNPGSGGCNGPTAQEQMLSVGLLDPASGYTIYGSDGVFPMKVFKIKDNAGDAAPTENAGPPLQLLGGTAVPACDGNAGAGDVSLDGGATYNFGEVYAQGGVIDPAAGYVYFGTDSNPGQVVKVAYSQQSAIKGTQITVAAPSVVNDVQFYSSAASGHLRLAIYDNGTPKSLLWDSGSRVNATANGWVSMATASGAPSSLSLAAGTYWLCWQVDNTLDIPSYSAGAAGSGFILEQPYGAFPASLAGASSSSENWSIYADISPAPTVTVSATPSQSPTPLPGSPTNSPTPSLTATITVTAPGTFTCSPTATPTATPSPSPTATPTAPGTFTPTPTGSPVNTPALGAAMPGQVYSYPNPAVPGQPVTIVFDPCAAASVAVFDWSGRPVLQLDPGSIQAGLGQAHWNARDAGGNDLASGLYFLALKAGPKTLIQKFTVLRP